MKLADVLARVRLDVNDVHSERYLDAHLVDLVNEAYCEMFNVRPDLFQKKVVARLEAGEVQEVCCCAKIRAVEALTDANGVKVAQWREVDEGASAALGRKRGCAVGGYPTAYSLEEGSNRFTVSPPVKPGAAVFARLVCEVRPEHYGFDLNQTLDNTGCEYYGALVDYVLFRLYGTETESATSAAQSQWHYRLFYERLNLHKKAKEAFEKGAEAGETGR